MTTTSKQRRTQRHPDDLAPRGDYALTAASEYRTDEADDLAAYARKVNR